MDEASEKIPLEESILHGDIHPIEMDQQIKTEMEAKLKLRSIDSREIETLQQSEISLLEEMEKSYRTKSSHETLSRLYNPFLR